MTPPLGFCPAPNLKPHNPCNQPKVRTRTPLFSAKTSSIVIAPIPTPQVVELASAQPSYVEAKTEAKPPQDIQLHWTISHYRQLKEVILVWECLRTCKNYAKWQVIA